MVARRAEMIRVTPARSVCATFSTTNVAEKAHADLTHFVVLEAVINRSEHRAIKKFYSLCEADAVLADVLLVFGAVPLELPGHPIP